MVTTDKVHIASLVEIMVHNDIHHVVISPGSRNAPLTIAFDSHPKIKHYLIHDERVAGFFALGLAEGLGKPVALSCTSGSAPLNYTPAIVEAYYRQIPLLVLTADRPAHLIDQGDGQCIRQEGIYSNFIKSSFSLKEKITEKDSVVFDQSVTKHAIGDLLSKPHGPIHINIPLSEPLYQVADFNNDIIHNEIKINSPETLLPIEKQKKLVDIWKTSTKKLVIVGQLNQSEQIQNVLEVLAQQNSVAVLVENTSNLQSFSSYNHCIDRSLALISVEEIGDFAPDLILSFGGAIVSKKIKAFLRKNKPKHNWRLGHYLVDEDTFLSKTENIYSKPLEFLTLLSNQEEISFSNYGQHWKSKDFIAMERHELFLESAPFSDLTVVNFILDTLPDNSILQMANSSVVRYCQLFNPIRSIKYFSNRGVSGIDGSTSTSVGMAKALPNDLVTLITGDISFFYDSNGFWIDNLPSNLRIFLINNNGGGIFNILEGSRKSEQNKLFVAPHKAKASSICEAYGIDYDYYNTIEALESNIHDFYRESHNSRPKLIEIDTAGCPNHDTLMNYFKSIAGSI